MAPVFSDLIGQEKAVEALRRAVAGDSHAMTHAWLFVGPPGSGRSNAAKAFAAALQCPSGGCGQCDQCRTVLTGAHPDVSLVRTEQLSIGVKEVREMVARADLAPAHGRYQIVVVEDADRATERGADALLKALEEPAPRTIWLLCAPSPDDVIITIRSRCRVVQLLTPSDEAVAQLLVSREGIDPSVAAQAARAAQGHVGRAKALALSSEARRRRHQILGLPSSLHSVGDCLRAASQLVEAANADANEICAPLEAAEIAQLQESLSTGGKRRKGIASAMKDLEGIQKARRTRLVRDALDRVLTELTTLYRDMLIIQLGANSSLINSDLASQITVFASTKSAEQSIRALDVILDTREKLFRNVTTQLAFEALLLGLARA